MSKKGRLTLDEIQFINDNAASLSYIEIAHQLDRDPKTIRAHVEQIGYSITIFDDKPASFKNPIEKKHFWPSLQQMFTPMELQIFISYWNNFNEQFNNDVLPTEELQIVDIIKLELMASKILKSIRAAEQDVELIQMDLRKKEKLGASDIAALKDAQSNNNIAIAKMQDQLMNIQNRKDSLLKALKGTRESRIKDVTSNKETLIDWLADNYFNPEKRRALGIEMEKFRLSMIDEEVRLAAYHKYEDGKIDQPLINSETVKDDNTL